MNRFKLTIFLVIVLIGAVLVTRRVKAVDEMSKVENTEKLESNITILPVSLPDRYLVPNFNPDERWVARDGSIWRILAIDSAMQNFPIIAMNVDSGQVEYFTAGGRAHMDGTDSPRDLLSIEGEGIHVTTWTLIMRGTPLECTLNREVADGWKRDNSDVLELSGDFRR